MTVSRHDVATYARRVRRGRIEESFLGLQRMGDEPLAVFHGFPPEPGDVAAQLVFGGCAYHEEALAIMGGVCWPMMWLQGDSCNGKHVAGTQAIMVHGVDIRRLERKGHVVGSCWSDADADYCLLAGILPEDVTAPRPVQARQVFEGMEGALAQAGMSFREVVRTWLFLDGLLDWYGDFNAVRTAFFQERGVFDHLVPASTGIGAANPGGAALLAGAVAIRPKHAGVTIAAVESPLQCPALNYRSSFSRAVEIRLPAHRLLYISGTASITPDGRTAHAGDLESQIALTMDVVAGILLSRGMSWSNVSRGIAYFQDAGEAPCLDRYCRDRNRALPPVAVSSADICRDDLLFEIEIDAVAAWLPAKASGTRGLDGDAAAAELDFELLCACEQHRVEAQTLGPIDVGRDVVGVEALLGSATGKLQRGAVDGRIRLHRFHFV